MILQCHYLIVTSLNLFTFILVVRNKRIPNQNNGKQLKTPKTKIFSKRQGRERENGKWKSQIRIILFVSGIENIEFELIISYWSWRDCQQDPHHVHDLTSPVTQFNIFLLNLTKLLIKISSCTQLPPR